MRKLLVAVLTAIVAGGTAAGALAATRTVRVGDLYFVRDGGPRTITVDRGTRVRFKWVGNQLHNVHAVRGPRRFRSRLKASGTFTRRLVRAGTYRIVCDPHEGAGMRLTIRVR